MSPETILVLDDDPLVQRTILRILTLRGFIVLTASSGQEALAVLATHPAPIDLLMADLRMRFMSGREAVAEAKRRYPRLRTLFMSGGSDPGDGTFLQKPFTIQSLIHKVESAFEG